MSKQEKDRIKNEIARLETELAETKTRLENVLGSSRRLSAVEDEFKTLAQQEKSSRAMKYRQPIYNIWASVGIEPEYNHQTVGLGSWVENLRQRIKDNEIDIENLRAELEEAQ